MSADAITTTSTTRRTRRFSSRRLGQIQATVATMLILAIGGIVILLPFFWMLSTSLKEQQDTYAYPPEWIPNPLQWVNYQTVLDLVPIARYALNSFIIVACVLFGTLLSCSFTAYGFARLRAPGRDAIFFVVLATLMLPTTVTLVPTYIAFNNLGWINSFLPLIVPAFFGTPFYIFLLRQFYLSLPRELEESAKLDGANSYRIWWDMMLPLSLPALATVAVFTFIATYNDFFGPLIYLSDESKRTIAVALSYFTGSPDAGPQMHLLMAMAVLATIPSMVVFLLAQRLFVQGIVTTGLKG